MFSTQIRVGILISVGIVPSFVLVSVVIERGEAAFDECLGSETVAKFGMNEAHR